MDEIYSTLPGKAQNIEILFMPQNHKNYDKHLGHIKPQHLTKKTNHK